MCVYVINVYCVYTCVSMTCINIDQCDTHVCVCDIYVGVECDIHVCVCDICGGMWREPPGGQRVVSVIRYDFLPYSFESESLAVPGVHGDW